MLNGVDPVLIFHFGLDTQIASDISGIPVIGPAIINNLGAPIPIYLSENLTGIFVDSEGKALDIETSVDAKSQGGTPDVSQRGIDNLVTIHLKASKSSIMLSALSALSDMIFQKVVSQTYTVSYFNGATTIINGLLHGFSTSLEANSDLVLITLQISKSNQKINQKPVATSLPKITGAKPIG